MVPDTPDAIIGIYEFISFYGNILNQVIKHITENEVLMTMFCGSLLVLGAKVFKRIKNASK